MQIEVIGAFIIGLTVGLQFLLRANYADLKSEVSQLQEKLNERENVPYWMRSGMEDAMAPGVDLLVELQRIRVLQENNNAWIDRAELKVKRQIELFGQIRGGTYNKDQPANRPPGDGTK